MLELCDIQSSEKTSSTSSWDSRGWDSLREVFQVVKIVEKLHLTWKVFKKLHKPQGKGNEYWRTHYRETMFRKERVYQSCSFTVVVVIGKLHLAWKEFKNYLSTDPILLWLKPMLLSIFKVLIDTRANLDHLVAKESARIEMWNF